LGAVVPAEGRRDAKAAGRTRQEVHILPAKGTQATRRKAVYRQGGRQPNPRHSRSQRQKLRVPDGVRRQPVPLRNPQKRRQLPPRKQKRRRLAPHRRRRFVLSSPSLPLAGGTDAQPPAGGGG